MMTQVILLTFNVLSLLLILPVCQKNKCVETDMGG